MPDGILIIAHGTSDAAGMAAYGEIIEQARAMLPGANVEGAFLECAAPTFAQGIENLAARGATHIDVVPLFLAALGHTADDLPKLAAQAAGRHGGIKITLKPPIGRHRRVVELSALRFTQSLVGRAEVPAEKTLWIIAAHGSPEPAALDELADFARRRSELTPVGGVEPCFVALGRPLLADVLPQAAALSFRRIVVQPHLLLKGRFFELIRRQVDARRKVHPDIEWIVAEPLAPDHLLAKAVVEG
jgi:sirohydrochlorin cobaltochelatase